VPRVRDLGALCDAADRILTLVRDRVAAIETPEPRDQNDRVFLIAFGRAYRSLRSIRQLACRGEAEDAAVLARSLLSLALQYLWLISADDEAERRGRLRRLTRKWATEYARIAEELLDLDYLPQDGTDDDLHRSIRQYRATADALEQEGVPGMLDERALALRLDQDLQPESPRFFELMYARIYRPTSHVAHFGLGAVARGILNRRVDEGLVLDDTDEREAADSLGLALVVYGAFLDFSETIVGHGATDEVGQIIHNAHQPDVEPVPEPGFRQRLAQWLRRTGR
jgi:HEPN domain-containing protein